MYDVKTYESTFIPPQTRHRLENADLEVPLEIIEVQNGPYLGEDDIVRFDDDFGRK
jgi:mannose-6-phosphate isomerase-like protein (cupin superfamily)